MYIGIWSLVFGLWYLVFGLWYLVFGIWSLVFGLSYLVYWYLIFGIWSSSNVTDNLPEFNQIWIWTDIHVSPQYQISRKSVQFESR